MAHWMGRNWTRAELTRYVGSMEQVAGIQYMENMDGRERQVRLLQVWTGSGLVFRVMADRCLDISACQYYGRSLAWHSASGEVHPSYYEAEGIGWLRSFPGGLLATCGLDQFGPPTADQGQPFPLHGRVGNLPAKSVSYRAAWQGDEYELEVSGEVRQARLFGENLVLRRRISTRLGSSKIRIEDQVTNEGFSPTPHMILYHFNLGYPLLSPDSRLELDARQTIARDADAEAGLATWSQFTPPTGGFREQVFRHTLVPGPDGLVRAKLVNPEIKLSLTLSYNPSTLPHLFQWKMMGEGEYVLGIEPANSSAIEGRAVARQREDLPMLAPAETRLYQLEIEVQDLP
jgi:hypothetical protein